MKKPESVICKNCIFFVGAEYHTSCHRNPPTLVGTNDSVRSDWPSVWERDFCGEFKPADNLTTIEWVAWKKGLLEDELPK